MSDERRLTPRGQERRDQIIAFATARFASHGYHPTSVADIVDGLGVGKGVFYWYFDSKETLFSEILRSAQTDLRRRQLAASASVEDPVARLGAALRESVAWSAEHRELATLFDFALTDERFAPLIQAGRAALVYDAATAIRREARTGRLGADDPELAAYAIFGVATILTAEFLHRRDGDPDAIADAVVTFCLRGIGAATPPRPVE